MTNLITKPLKGYKRTQIYQNLDYNKPKHLFEVICRKMQAFNKRYCISNILDVGGASGAFAYHVQRCFPEAKVSCLEYDEKLCDLGRENVKECEFICASAEDMSMIEDQSYDVVTMLAVLSIFDDFAPSINECLRVAQKGGKVYILTHFNDYPLDVMVSYRYSDRENSGDYWNRGYNYFSKKSIEKHLKGLSCVHSFEFEKFRLPFDIEPQEDPIRNWTEYKKNGEQFFVNGLNLLLNLEILTIDLKPKL